MSEMGGLGGFSTTLFKLLCPLFWGQNNPDIVAMFFMCQAIDLYSGVRWIYPLLALFAVTCDKSCLNDTTHAFFSRTFLWVWDFSDWHQSSLPYATTNHQIIWEQRCWWIYKSEVIICAYVLYNHGKLFSTLSAQRWPTASKVMELSAWKGYPLQFDPFNLSSFNPLFD